MLRVRRRGTTRTPFLAFLAALTFSLALTPLTSGATSITQLRTELLDLTAALSRQEARSETTSNQYDAEEGTLSTLNANIVNLQAEEVKKHAAIVVTAKKLELAVVREYVFGASDAQIISIFNQNVTRSDARSIYQDQVIGNLNKLKKDYQHQKRSLQHTVANVATQRAKARNTSQQLKVLLAENIELENSTSATLASVKGQLRVELINYEIRAGVAAAKAHNTAAEESAVVAASAVGGQTAANEVIEAEQAAASTVTIAEIAGTAQGLRAVAYAKSQIGVPYVWGGETPGVGFDCSGLVQWAWAKAGISIPRTTETQWPDMLHVSLQQLQPGDLLFYYNLDGDHEVDHVVMYVGSGPWGSMTTIAAAHTGTNVALAPLFTAGLYGAARP